MKQDTYSYKGWMVSDRFIKRVIGVAFHYGVALVIFWTFVFLFKMLGALYELLYG